jgi:hypothetical protein
VQPAPVVDLIDEAGKPHDHFVEALVVTDGICTGIAMTHSAGPIRAALAQWESVIIRPRPQNQ